jgi:hypothetical protein
LWSRWRNSRSFGSLCSLRMTAIFFEEEQYVVFLMERIRRRL